MIIRRQKTKNYTVICNELLHRKDISARAKGIYAYIMTLPDDWQLFMSELFQHFTEGAGALKTAFKELETAGYITKQKRKTNNGRFDGWEYTVTEYANTDRTENRLSENRPVGECDLLSTNELSTNLLNTNQDIIKPETENTSLNHPESEKEPEDESITEGETIPESKEPVPPTKKPRPLPYTRYKLTKAEIWTFELYRKLLFAITENWHHTLTGYAHESIGGDARKLAAAVKELDWTETKLLFENLIRGQVDDIIVKTGTYPKIADVLKIIAEKKILLKKG